ncbi:hypothetical protein LINPERHAP1_LOCUS35160, partial [Linum perenne]
STLRRSRIQSGRAVEFILSLTRVCEVTLICGSAD